MDKMAERLGLEDTEQSGDAPETSAEPSQAVRDFMARLAEAQAAEAAQPTLEEQRQTQALRREQEQDERARAEADLLSSVVQRNASGALAFLRFSNLKAVETQADLISLIQDFVTHSFVSERRAVRLYEINRRFGLKATKLGADTAQLAVEVTRSGEVGLMSCRGVALLYPTREYMQHLWSLPGQPERELFKEEMLNRGMDTMPSSRRTGTARRR